MRMRLRAPDEPEAESSYDGDGNGSAPSTPERSHLLPPLDVGSPEYIEERLENLKRRPNWGDFLDQYVQEHPDSDSDSESGDFAEVLAVDTPGFVRSTLWSLLVVTLAPLLIFCYPCLRHKGFGFWPFGCRSMKELFGTAVANVIFMVFGLVLLYWAICRELPDVFRVDNTLVKLNVQIDEAQRAADTCHAALLQWERAVAQELCMPVGIDATLLMVNVWLLLHYHRRWARYLMLMMTVMFVVDMPTKLYDATFPAPEIHKLDPTFAMVDEELLVALDGKNLKPGGSVAWVAYWGCATTSNVDACEKQFASTFEVGNVAVTFKALDHFIPCYRDPPNPLKAQEYQCFEDVRIRVKDMQSIPGWSRSVPHSSSGSETDPHLSDEWHDKLEIPSFKRDEKPVTTGNVIKPTHSNQRMARSSDSSEAVESESFSNKHSGPKKKAFGYSDERGAQQNESLTESSEPNRGKRDEKLKEVEVTSDAEVKINTEPEHGPESVPPVENSRERTPTIEDLHDSSDAKVKVEVEKMQDQASAEKVEMISADKAEEPERTVAEIKVEFDVPVTEKVRIVDEEIKLSTMTVILKDENVKKASSDSQEPNHEVGVEKALESNTHDARSEKVSAPSIPEKKLKKSDSKHKTSTPVDSTVQAKKTNSKSREDATSDGSQAESANKKRKNKRTRRAKEDSGPAIVDTAGNTAAAV